jgi:nucleoside diphosphate kinase
MPMSTMGWSLLLIKPDAAEKVHTILQRVDACGLTVRWKRAIRLSTVQAEELYAGHRQQQFYEELIAFMTSGDCVAVMVTGEHAVERLNAACGFNQPTLAASWSLRALFGTDPTRNAVHSSCSARAAIDELKLLFPVEVVPRDDGMVGTYRVEDAG